MALSLSNLVLALVLALVLFLALALVLALAPTLALALSLALVPVPDHARLVTPSAATSLPLHSRGMQKHNKKDISEGVSTKCTERVCQKSVLRRCFDRVY